MNMPMDQLVERLAAITGYRDWFSDGVAGEGVSETTVIAGWATFDRLVAGNPEAVPSVARPG